MTIPDSHDDNSAADQFWAVDLPAADHALLEQAFHRDRSLRAETALMFGDLIDLDLRDTFIAALIRQLRTLQASQRPVGAIIPALEDTLAAARARGQTRSEQG